MKRCHFRMCFWECNDKFCYACFSWGYKRDCLQECYADILFHSFELKNRHGMKKMPLCRQTINSTFQVIWQSSLCLQGTNFIHNKIKSIVFSKSCCIQKGVYHNCVYNGSTSNLLTDATKVLEVSFEDFNSCVYLERNFVYPGLSLGTGTQWNLLSILEC